MYGIYGTHNLMSKEEAEQLIEDLRAWCGDARVNRGRRSQIAKAVRVERASIRDYLSGRSAPSYANGLKLKAFLKKQKRKK
jgi:predicted transcriptional regulator